MHFIDPDAVVKQPMRRMQWHSLEQVAGASGIRVPGSNIVATNGQVGMINGCILAVIIQHESLPTGFGFTVYAFGPPYCFNYQPCPNMEDGKKMVESCLEQWIATLTGAEPPDIALGNSVRVSVASALSTRKH